MKNPFIYITVALFALCLMILTMAPSSGGGTSSSSGVSQLTVTQIVNALVGSNSGMTQVQHQGSLLAHTNNYTGTNIDVMTGRFSSLIVTNLETNSSLTASTEVNANANKALVSLANGTGVETNNGSGGKGYTQTPTISGAAITANTIPSASLVSPVTLSSLYATNFVTPTNFFAGAVVDFSSAEGTTNMSGNLTITGIANATADGYNAFILHCNANGSDRTVAVPASWGVGYGSTLVVSNGTHKDFLFRAQIGLHTNVSELQMTP